LPSKAVSGGGDREAESERGKIRILYVEYHGFVNTLLGYVKATYVLSMILIVIVIVLCADTRY